MENEPRVIDDVKLVLNYEQLLSRAIDRCMYYRCKTDNQANFFINSVRALISIMVDMPGKPIHSELMPFHNEHLKTDKIFGGVERYGATFEKACEILAKYRILFRGASYEVGEPIESKKEKDE